MKIAQALLLRKQLEKKVAQLEPIKTLGDQGLFETKVKRLNVTEQTDEVSIQVPKMTLGEVTAEYDKFASALRKLDASIQKANWEFEVDFTEKENPFEK
jgi:predicted negative regulator of RcsB-dependent stress response